MKGYIIRYFYEPKEGEGFDRDCEDKVYLDKIDAVIAMREHAKHLEYICFIEEIEIV